jgi:hypothetical protein
MNLAELLIGVAAFLLLLVMFMAGFYFGYAEGVSDILECETDLECELIAHKAGK